MKKIFVLIALLIGVLLLSGCSTGPVKDDLTGTGWVLDSWAAAEFSPAQYSMTMVFGNGSAAGWDGANQFNSTYVIGGGKSLTFKNITTSKQIAGDAQVSSAEEIYLNFLDDVRRYSLKDNKLILQSSMGGNLLSFHRQ